jgi:ubiquinone/menaquinone biosynthesis C-methylase UbiE
MKEKFEAFEKFAEEYDAWYDRFRYVYASELEAIRKNLRKAPDSLEIGVGSGRFAAPLGIRYGLEPSGCMGRIARRRGVTVVRGEAEYLPFKGCHFSCLLLVTTLCFLDDAQQALKEVWRVLRPGGQLTVGFIDRNSALGISYQKHKQDSTFFKTARFYSAAEVKDLLQTVGFESLRFCQTIFKRLDRIEKQESIKDGYGEGSFVVVRALKRKIS